MFVPAGTAAQSALLDRYLNDPLQEPGRFVPASRHAMMVWNTIDRMQSKVSPRWGWTSEQEMAAWLLIADTRTRRLLWFHPYMLVDNDAAMVSGREVYGFPKALGWFDIPRGPSAPARLQVETMLVRKFGDDSPRERAPLMTAHRVSGDGEQSGEAVGSLGELVLRAVQRLELDFDLLTDFDLAGEAMSALTTFDVPMVFLKQVRSAEDPRVACFQCVQQVAASCDALHDARLYVGQRYELEIHDADSHPIRRDLGLPNGRVAVALAFWANFDLTIGDCTHVGHGVARRVAPKERIAILGGGVGSMTTAFELTNEPDWQERYDITVYQLGHRLGGKGASGRGPNGRIEEHGLHVWLGFYENAFRIIRQVYAELTPGGSAPGTPEIVDGVFSSWDKAFHKHSDIAVFERDASGRLSPWLFRFPQDGDIPGDPSDEHTLWNLIVQVLEWMAEAARVDSSSQLWQRSDADVHVSLFARIRRIHSDLSLALDVIASSLGLATLEALVTLVKRIPPGVADRTHLDEQFVWLLQTLQSWILEEIGRVDPLQKRLLTLLDMGAALVRGLVTDHVLEGRDLGVLDEDFRRWLARHGARDQTLDLQQNPLLRGLYDFVFAFVDGDTERLERSASFETSAAVRTILRMLFTYRGAIFWKMNAGMGDTIFAPLYKVLKQRGVRFEFFSKVERLELDATGEHIESIEITRQATPIDGAYQPLERVNGLDCWPSSPRYDQLREAEALVSGRIELESIWSPWPGAGTLTLRRGDSGAAGFDRVVFGLSLGSVPFVCRALVERMPAWRDMVEHVRTVRTMGVQLWMRPGLRELGWTSPPAVTTAFAEPLDTWADMTHLAARETWPTTPSSIAYFCGPLRGPEPNPADLETPAQARAEVERALRALLTELRVLWPNAFPEAPGELDPALIVDRYLRANIDPSERYVLSVAGSSKYRLRADASGVTNLVLTGDWIDNGFNAGCVEAAVLGGIQAANALRGRERMHGVLGRELLGSARELGPVAAPP